MASWWEAYHPRGPSTFKRRNRSMWWRNFQGNQVTASRDRGSTHFQQSLAKLPDRGSNLCFLHLFLIRCWALLHIHPHPRILVLFWNHDVSHIITVPLPRLPAPYPNIAVVNTNSVGFQEPYIILAHHESHVAALSSPLTQFYLLVLQLQGSEYISLGDTG